MKRVLLTIDDSPSAHTKELVDFLTQRNIPAILFCRGDRMEVFGDDALVYALQKGVVLAHHSYDHQPAGEMEFDIWCDDFMRMHDRLQAVYDRAGVEWAIKMYRFPYIDRGDGDRIERRFPDLANQGKIEVNNRVHQIQLFLKEQGYVQDFGTVRHPLYQNECVKNAYDCLFTYSSCDWMLTERHRGKQRYKSLEDLKTAMDQDQWLNNEILDHIALFHDESEIHDIVKNLIDYMMGNRCVFVRVF